MTGAEMQRNKEAVAAKMREKQAAGKKPLWARPRLKYKKLIYAL